MANGKKAPEVSIVDGDYRRDADVVLEIARTVPQPDKRVVEQVRVKDLKRELEDIAKRGAEDSARKAEIEAVLADHKAAIQAAVTTDNDAPGAGKA